MSANAKSMNGINNIEINEVQFPDGSTITSAKNLVQLDTNNNFTSFNTYNTNLPTSDVNPELGVINNNTILNKHAADKLYTGTDQNDYPTAFTRNGTTGVVKLTTSTTGTPLTGDTIITSITDTQINAIGTNTSNISTLTTTTNSCFDTASFSTPTLTLTDVEGNDTNINIGGGGAPAFVGCRYFPSTSSGAFQFPWIFSVQDYDTDNIYNTTTGIFTIPTGKGGKYCFWIHVTGTNNGAAGRFNILLWKSPALFPNGGSPAGARVLEAFPVLPGSRDSIGAYVASVFDCVAGDTFAYANATAVAQYNAGANNRLDTQYGCYKVD